MSDDIVARLRDCTCVPHGEICREAADEIERLHRDYSCICLEMRRMMDERDEARREVCCFHHLTGFLSGDYAISRGWDCYKNYSGEGFPPSVTDFEEFLKGQDQIWLDRVDRLTKERDDARRRYCFAMAEHGEEAEARQNAEDEGWDCFKETTDER